MFRFFLLSALILSGCGHREPTYYGVKHSQWIIMTQEQKEQMIKCYTHDHPDTCISDTPSCSSGCAS